MHVTRFGERNVAVRSARGCLIGHAAGGYPGGPNSLVPGAGAEAAAGFDRLLCLPVLGLLRDRLVLLRLVRFDDWGKCTVLGRHVGSRSPIKEARAFSPVVLHDVGRAAAPTRTLMRMLIRLFGWSGLLRFSDRSGSHIFRD